jgi:hypothetical protein
MPWFTGTSSRRARFDPALVRMRFVVKNVALGQILSEYFEFRLSVSFHKYPFLDQLPTLYNLSILQRPYIHTQNGLVGVENK